MSVLSEDSEMTFATPFAPPPDSWAAHVHELPDPGSRAFDAQSALAHALLYNAMDPDARIQIENLREDLRALASQNETLDAYSKSMYKLACRTREEIRILVHQSVSATKEVEELRKQLEDTRNGLRACEEEKDGLSKLIYGAESQRKIIERERDAAQAELNDLKEEETRLRDTNGSVEKLCKWLQEALRVAHSERDNESQLRKDTDALRMALEADRNQILAERAALAAERDGLQTKLAVANVKAGESNRYYAQVKRLQAQVDHQSGTMSIYKSEIKRLQAQVDGERDAVNGQKSECQRLKSAVRRLQRQVDEQDEMLRRERRLSGKR